MIEICSVIAWGSRVQACVGGAYIVSDSIQYTRIHNVVVVLCCKFTTGVLDFWMRELGAVGPLLRIRK